MDGDVLPEDPAKQWEILLCIIAFEEKNKEHRPDGSLPSLAYYYNHHGIKDIMLEWIMAMKNKYDRRTRPEDASGKNDEISLLWRKKGNTKYRLGNYADSIDYYTYAVLYADKNGSMYSLALANRSAATLKLRNYKSALKDVDRALSTGYPEDIKHKLLIRRAECLIEMGHRDEAAEAVRVALEHNSQLELSGQSLADFQHMVSELNEKISACRKPPDKITFELPELFIGENPEFSGASLAVDLKYNEDYGRHVVTNRPVNRGDVLFAETPFAAVKLSTIHLPSDMNYCDYCCTGEVAVIGCDSCSRAMYCSDECQEIGHETYHRWECAGVRSNIFDVIGISHLALRVLIQYANMGFPKLPESAGSPTTAAELFECYKQVGKIESFKKEYSPFYSMFQLSSNVDKAPITDNIQYALTSTMLTLYLETYTSFFDFFATKIAYALPPEEQTLLALGLIFRTLGQLVINAHTILDTKADPPDIYPGDYLDCFCKVGTAIYPAAAMMNHSCDPNIVNLFYKNKLFVKGNKEILESTEVLNSYGPHYARESQNIRKEKLLSQYGFDCACEACSDESRKDFTSLFTAYACPSCKGPVTWDGDKNRCHQCTNDFPLERAQSSADTANSMHETVKCKRCKLELDEAQFNLVYQKSLDLKYAAYHMDSPKAQCDLMASAYRLMQTTLYRHNNALRRTVDDLARKYAVLGDYTKAVEMIKQNVQSFEYQFGSFSVEVTNEIRKMANLMIGRILKFFDDPEADERQPINIKDWIRETLKIVKKANQLMEMNFGSWKPLSYNLKRKEALLEELLTLPRLDGSPECKHYKQQLMHTI